MHQIFSKTLPTSDADLDVQSLNFDDPESLNLELAEKVIQRKLRTILDELGDITRMTICLAERQSNRYKKAVKETLNKDEHCLLHARVKTSNSISWSAEWRVGGYKKTVKGIQARTKRIRMKADGSYPVGIFKHAGPSLQAYAVHTETNFSLLRDMGAKQTKIREAIYQCSTCCKKFFDYQSNPFADNSQRPSCINREEAIQRFNDRLKD